MRAARRARESARSLARSLARPACCSTLEHYLLLLTLCVVHARRPLQPMIAADDVVVGCCRALSVAVALAVPPFRTLPPFGLTVNYLPPPPPPPPPLPHPAALGPSRDELGDRQARAEKRQQQQQARRRRHRQRHPMRGHRIVVAHAELWQHSPPGHPGSRISDTHTRNLRSRYAELRSDYGAAAWSSSSQRRVVIRN